MTDEADDLVRADSRAWADAKASLHRVRVAIERGKPATALGLLDALMARMDQHDPQRLQGPGPAAVPGPQP